MKKMLWLLIWLTASALADNPYRILYSFNGGELSELLTTREDLSKYQSGLSLAENVLVLPQGGVEKRPGTVYVAESKENTKIRLLPFEYSASTAYVIEAGNQYFRFYTDQDVIYSTYGTETFPSAVTGALVAHWKCNETSGTEADNAEGTAALDADTDGTDLSTMTIAGPGGTGTAFDLSPAGGDETLTVPDHASLSFGDGASDSPFSITAWIYVVATADGQIIAAKYQAAGTREWYFAVSSEEKLRLVTADDSAGGEYLDGQTINALSAGWHFVAVTYSGTRNASAPSYDDASKIGMRFYVDWVEQEAWIVRNGSGATYVAMEDLAADMTIGSYAAGTWPFKGYIDNLAIFSKELTDVEVASLTGSDSTTPAEIETPYLTADLYDLHFAQSADVMYLTHPDYEPRKLSRLSNSIWKLESTGYETGPFRLQNDDENAKISSTATTGSVTLTATGCAPFVDGTTGFEPTGSAGTDASNTGALFKIVQPVSDLEYRGRFTEDYDADNTEDTSWGDCGILYEGTTWTLVTTNTWYGTLEIQRNYNLSAARTDSGWETILEFSSGGGAAAGARNVSTTGTQDDGDALYHIVFTVDDGGTLDISFTTDQTEHIGIVKITAVASTTSATGTVVRTLASTDATHKWSEGAWSNYRGWPGAVTFFEDRLIYGGNTAQPDTIWGSATGDYEDFLEGTDDDEAVNFTLSARQVNSIQWMTGKNKLLIGTAGGEWTLAGSNDEPLTPSNVKASLQSTYGSENLQAELVNESVLFFQKNAKKMRELAYNWELDSYVAPDMTILNPGVTGDGITNTGYQQIPNSILWCVRDDGQMPVFSYERREEITAWSRLITDGTFESVAIINGDPENEVWASVNRTIDGSTVRYIEYFSDREYTNPYFVDCGTLNTTVAPAGGTITISGLDHLEGELVAVYADGTVISDGTDEDYTVSSGAISWTDSESYDYVYVGLPYTVQVRTMPISWVSDGMTIQGRIKRINQVISRYYNAGDFSIGPDSTRLESVPITGVGSDFHDTTFPPGFDRPGYILIYQKSPEPLTVLSLMAEFATW